MRFFGLLNSYIEKLFRKTPFSAADRGQKGEKLAASFLRKKGYSIRDKGWRWRRYELDIIAEKQNMVIFVEVKTRKSEKYGAPETAVNSKKKKHIAQAARWYIKQKSLSRKLIRFDIISVIIDDDGQTEVRHLENAFEIRL